MKTLETTNNYVKEDNNPQGSLLSSSLLGLITIIIISVIINLS